MDSIKEYKLKNENGISAIILSYGGIIKEINTPNRKGEIENIVLNYDLNDEYFRCDATFKSPENGIASQTEIPDEVTFTFKLRGYEGPANCNSLNQSKLRKCWEL